MTPVSEILVEIQSGAPEVPPLFLVHPVGGSVFCYMDLAASLGPERRIYGLQAPSSRANIFEQVSVEEMAADYIAEVRSVQPQGPYLLGGWSMGGVVAFEMARRLQGDGEVVSLVALLDSEPLGGASGFERVSDLVLLADLALDLGVTAERYRAAVEGETSFEAALRKLLAAAVDEGVLTPGTTLDEFQARFDVLRANHQALRAYRPESYEGRVTLLKAMQTVDGEPAAGDAGWTEWAPRLESRLVPGHHYTLIRRPQVEALADELRAAIAWAEMGWD